MKKRFYAIILLSAFIISMFSGCGNSSQGSTEALAPSEDITADNNAKEAEDASKTAGVESASINPEEEAARQEEANTYYEAGRSCLYGLNGQEIDLEEAYANFEDALELGKTEANLYLGILYDWYSYPEVDYKKVRAFYEAAGDNPYAQLAFYFSFDYDSAKAQELYEAVIAEGCAEGYLGLASIADAGGDYDTAFEYYNNVLEGEEQIFIAYAMYCIGYMYQHGDGVELDYAKAMEWYEKAADLGHADAMNQIGYMYQHELGVALDYAKAMEWYEKAADLRSSMAMNQIGFMYDMGLGVEQDYGKAMEWYEKAADLGNATAMDNIGSLYEEGLGVEQDLSKAQEWYDKAAKAQ